MSEFEEKREYIKQYQKEWREANKEKIKEWREANKEKIKQYSEQYIEANKEKIKQYSEQYREANKEKRKQNKEANKEKIKQYSEQYREANKEKIKQYREANKEKIKEWREANKEKIKQYSEQYREANNERVRERRKTDPLFKMTCALRGRTSGAFKNKGYSKNTKTQEILGVDWGVCKSHIERQFTKGMKWSNHGEWQIDHIIPLASANNEKDLIKLCHYRNLQPLWAVDNLSKSAKIIGQQSFMRL